jgi:hypothetical protein
MLIGREEVGRSILPQHQRGAVLHVDMVARVIRTSQCSGGFDDDGPLVEVERIIELTVVTDDAKRPRARLGEPPSVRAAAVWSAWDAFAPPIVSVKPASTLIVAVLAAVAPVKEVVNLLVKFGTVVFP